MIVSRDSEAFPKFCLRLILIGIFVTGSLGVPKPAEANTILIPIEVSADYIFIEKPITPYRIDKQPSEYEKSHPTTTQAVNVRKTTNLTVNSGYNYGGNVEILDKGRQEYYNCVAYVRSVRYMPQTRNGNAGTTPINSKTPQVGAIAVMRGHVALVQSYTDSTVTIVEGNFYHGYKTRRVLSRSVVYGYFN